jgi:peptide/nickel transport system ATP-binding protein
MSLLAVEDLTIALPQAATAPMQSATIGFALEPGESLCVVGESGSGKSVCAAAIMGLLPPALQVRGGGISFEGIDLLRLSPAALRSLRGARIGMIFQEPMTALNPLMRVGDQIARS